MWGAKVKVSKETIKKAETITPQRKRELRNEAILKLIRSKPAGARIKLRDFMAVTGIKKDGIMHSHLKTMLNNGIITRYELAERKTYAYDIPADTKVTGIPMMTTELKKPEELGVQLKADNVKWNNLRELRSLEQRLADDVELLAMKFAWQASNEERNDLHAFVEWLKEDKNNG